MNAVSIKKCVNALDLLLSIVKKSSKMFKSQHPSKIIAGSKTKTVQNVVGNSLVSERAADFNELGYSKHKQNFQSIKLDCKAD